MNARHELDRTLDAADAIDEEPSAEEQREFWEWARLVSAETTLREAIEQGNPLAISYVRALARLLDEPHREQLVFPAENRLAHGPPPI